MVTVYRNGHPFGLGGVAGVDSRVAPPRPRLLDPDSGEAGERANERVPDVRGGLSGPALEERARLAACVPDVRGARAGECDVALTAGALPDPRPRLPGPAERARLAAWGLVNCTKAACGLGELCSTAAATAPTRLARLRLNALSAQMVWNATSATASVLRVADPNVVLDCV